MPILQREPDLFPADLLDAAAAADRPWWAIYTRSRREKDLMRRLSAMNIAFYAPMIARPQRSPSGRVRTAHLPLFSNYVFLCGDETDRYRAFTTNCVSNALPVGDPGALVRDLRRVRDLIAGGLPVTPEQRLAAGDPVRIVTGPLKGLEGVVIQRSGERRLLIAVQFLQQGASVQIEDWEVQPIC
jgi:transcription antitermination factor NusG